MVFGADCWCWLSTWVLDSLNYYILWRISWNLFLLGLIRTFLCATHGINRLSKSIFRIIWSVQHLLGANICSRRYHYRYGYRDHSWCGWPLNLDFNWIWGLNATLLPTASTKTSSPNIDTWIDLNYPVLSRCNLCDDVWLWIFPLLEIAFDVHGKSCNCAGTRCRLRRDKRKIK